MDEDMGEQYFCYNDEEKEEDNFMYDKAFEEHDDDI